MMGSQMNFYHFSVCHVCKKQSLDLKKCASCKILHYCTREHQRRDWPNHKVLCKIIAQNPVTYTPGYGFKFFNGVKYARRLLWVCQLSRELQPFEQHMWMFPKICSICYALEPTLTCEKCLSVAYCSEKHKNQHQETHDKACKDFRLCLDINQIIYNGKVKINPTSFNISHDVLKLPQTIHGVMKLGGHERPDEKAFEQSLNYILNTDFFTPAINIIYALETSNFIRSRRGKRSKLVIHLVGCDVNENMMDWCLIVEFLMHWVTNLEDIELYLIGPNIQVAPDNLSDLQNYVCEQCEVKSFNASMFRINSVYHHTVETIIKPDIVVAFNSGLHEFMDSKKDEWGPSISSLIHYPGVPLLLTAYTEDEIRKDIHRFRDLNVRFYLRPRRNPYADLRPNRNWEEGNETIYYQNGYISVICKN